MMRCNKSFSSSTLNLSVVGLMWPLPMPLSSVRKRYVPLVANAIDRIINSVALSVPLQATGTIRMPFAAALRMSKAISLFALSCGGASINRKIIFVRALADHCRSAVAACNAFFSASG